MPLFKIKEKRQSQLSLFGLTFSTPLGKTPNPSQTVYYNSYKKYGFVEIGPLTLSEKPVSRRRFNLIDCFVSVWRKQPQGTVRSVIKKITEQKPATLIAVNLTDSSSYPSGDELCRNILGAFSLIYDFADFFVLDTFRKTPDGTIPLQNQDVLSEVLDALLDMRHCYDEYKPILVRVDESINPQTLTNILDYSRYSGIDGIIAGYNSFPIDLVKTIFNSTQGRFPIIACGNISTGRQAEQLMEAGASLIQIEKNRKSIQKHIEQIHK